MNKTLITILLAAFCGNIATAQYRMEVGGSYGGNFYLGDGNPSYPFLNVNDQYGALIRMLITPRYALKFSGVYGTMSGSTAFSSNFLPFGAQFLFKKQFWDMGATLEYNFFPLTNEKGERPYYLTPYIMGGGGMTILLGALSGTAYEPNFQFGGGVKWKPWENVTIGAEIGMRKMFTDQLDTFTPLDALNDPYNLNGSILINNDYYTCFGIFAAVSLFKRKWHCGNYGTYN